MQLGIRFHTAPVVTPGFEVSWYSRLTGPLPYQYSIQSPPLFSEYHHYPSICCWTLPVMDILAVMSELPQEISMETHVAPWCPKGSRGGPNGNP